MSVALHQRVKRALMPMTYTLCPLHLHCSYNCVILSVYRLLHMEYSVEHYASCEPSRYLLLHKFISLCEAVQVSLSTLRLHTVSTVATSICKPSCPTFYIVSL